MPDHEVALELLARTGPLAVSSANRTGRPAATDADAAEEMLGTSVAVILDAGPTPGSEPSTIVDVTGTRGSGAAAWGRSRSSGSTRSSLPLGVEILDEG